MAVVGFLAIQTACAQQVSTNATEVDLPDQLQRLVQYEQILGDPLDASIGMCIDIELQAGWRLPDEPAAAQVALVKAESIVRQAHDNCLAMGQRENSQELRVLRAVSGLRLMLDKQRRVAFANERLAIARRCLQPNSEPVERKGCLQEATGDTLSGTQWLRWEVLYQLNQGRQ